MTIDNAQTIDLDRNQVSIDFNGCTVTSDADPVFAPDGFHHKYRNGRVVAQNGSAFTVTDLSNSQVFGVDINQDGDHPAWELATDASGFLDVLVEGGEYQTSGGLDAPFFNLVCSGSTAGAFTVRRLRLQTNGNSSVPTAPCVYLENTSASYMYGVTLEDINFEIPLAGAVHAYSMFQLSMRKCQVFDAHLGTITDDMILVDASSTGGLDSAGVRVEQYFRNTGSMGELFDINFAGHLSSAGVIAQPHGASPGNPCRITGSGYTISDSRWIEEV